jgi:prepilin-type N-terminal cleavage/methylation domain-containing protein
MNKRTNSAGSKGFSLIELIVVIAIILVVSAISLPNIMASMDTFRLRSAVSGLAGLLQETRILAVQKNAIYEARLGSLNGENVAFVDLNWDSTPQSTEPLTAANANVNIDYTGPGTAFPEATLLGYTNAAASPNPFFIGFNQRGLPCVPSPATNRPTSCSTGAVTTSTSSRQGFLYYFRIDSTFGTKWSVLSITPAGRIRVWTLSGSTWN